MEKVLIKLEKISKKFNDEYVIKNLSLDIYEGEFLTLLGPSGCGKTTILRMISGLENVTSGKVYLDGVDITDMSATKRAVNTIFQNFALFPHMTVYENINFGLKMHKVPKEEAKKRIEHAIDLVKLNGFENRYPRELSGGQQQRVAIARGIVMNHKVLLLDESLCSLDLKLKREMQIELKKIQKKLGMTFLYVTHDQDEALTMSDRIAIINNGIIQQLGTPKEIYRKPCSTFVADFIGESNIIKARVESVSTRITKVLLKDDIEFHIPSNNYKKGDKIKLIFRPECFEIYEKKQPKSLKGVVTEYIYDGMITKLVINISDNVNLKVNTIDTRNIKIGDIVYLKINSKYIIVIGD